MTRFAVGDMVAVMVSEFEDNAGRVAIVRGITTFTDAKYKCEGPCLLIACASGGQFKGWGAAKNGGIATPTKEIIMADKTYIAAWKVRLLDDPLYTAVITRAAETQIRYARFYEKR